MLRIWPDITQASRNSGAPISTVTKVPCETGALSTPRRTDTLLILKASADINETTTPNMPAAYAKSLKDETTLRRNDPSDLEQVMYWRPTELPRLSAIAFG